MHPLTDELGRLSDELDRLSAVTVRAEQSLLGEVLHRSAAPTGPAPSAPAPPDPSRRHPGRCDPDHSGARREGPVRLLMRWGLQPGDFLRPYHQQVYAAMLRLATAGQPTTPHTVRAELARDPCLPAQVARNGVRLADLMAAAGGHGSLAATAALVLEASTRRHAGSWGLRLAHAATAQPAEAADQPPSDLSPLVGYITAMREDLRRWRGRWSTLPPQLRDHLTTTSPAPQPAGLPLTAAPTGPEPDPAPGPDAGLLERELRLLASIATYPAQLGDLRRWLLPQHFRTAPARTLYQITLDRRARGQGVDPLTLAWLAHAHGFPHAARLADEFGDGQPWGRHLAVHLHAEATRAAALTTAQHTLRLAAATHHTAWSLLDLLDQALVQLLHLAGSPVTAPSQPAPARDSHLRHLPRHTTAHGRAVTARGTDHAA